MKSEISASQNICIGVLDDHPFVHDCIQTLFLHEQQIHVAWQALSPESAEAEIQAHTPDILLLDIQMQPNQANGFSLLQRIQKLGLATRTIVFSAHASKHLVTQSAKFGASGYFSKSGPLSELKDAIIQLATRGSEEFLGPYKAWANRVFNEISPREKEVLEMLCKGYTNQEIANRLNIGLATVKSHLENIFAKLGVRSRTDAMRVALKEQCVFISDL